MMKYLVFPVMLVLSGCASGRVGNSCDGWKSIRPAQSNLKAMSGGLVDQILTHNEHGLKTCGWKK